LRYEVKPVTDDMIAKCAAIFETVFAMPPWSENWKHEDAFQRIYDIYSTKNSINLACFDNGEIVGCLFGVLYKWHSGHQFEIKEFFVCAKLQGRGIGKTILHKLESSLSEMGSVEIFLQTLTHDNAIYFYKNQNYTIKSNYSIMGKVIK